MINQAILDAVIFWIQSMHIANILARRLNFPPILIRSQGSHSRIFNTDSTIILWAFKLRYLRIDVRHSENEEGLEIPMKIMCAWCGKLIGRYADEATEDTSHGICDECLRKIENEMALERRDAATGKPEAGLTGQM